MRTSEIQSPYYQKTTLADLNKVVWDLGMDPEAVHIEGMVSYPYPVNRKVGKVDEDESNTSF